MPAGKGKVQYAIVAVDYFTKFGIPNAIVTDNGRQFDNNKFRMFYSKFNIHLCFASPAHPQSNGQAEAINKIIKGTLKTSLDKAKEVVVPVELEQATFRVHNYGQSKNDKRLTLNLDLVEEHRNQAHLRNVAYKQRISNYYDSRVKPLSFKVGDWVLKKRLLCDRVPSEGTLSSNPSEGTLSSNWDGPFEVVGISRPGSYKLRSFNGKTLGHPWNADHLKYYYK
ncbi:hypothetical protein FF1_012741 [Malus domestica]